MSQGKKVSLNKVVISVGESDDEDDDDDNDGKLIMVDVSSE